MSGAARLSPADAALLYRETPATPQHMGWLAVFEVPAGGFDYDRLLRLIRERISLAPRYRQKLRAVPGKLADPVWVDDPGFDLTYHVRRSALPRPGTEVQLLEFAARVQGRALDRDRPLWEMYLVEGLAGGRFAVITKVHQALVNGSDAVDISEVLLDASPAPRRTVRADWVPAPAPGSVDLIAGAVRDAFVRPAELARSLARAGRDLRAAPARLAGLWTGAAGAAARVAGSAVRGAGDSPLRAGPGRQRRLALVRTELADYRQISEALGGTVDDVAVAAVTAAVRSWLLARGQRLRPHAVERALVPVPRVGPGGSRFRPILVDLPVGEPDPARRLAQLRYGMPSPSAQSGPPLAGLAPPTLAALAARAGSELNRRLYSLAITHVPGPQTPLYASGARMIECSPFLPLERGQAISVGLTSYAGGVYYGISADYHAVPDVDKLAGLVAAGLAELTRAAGSAAPARGSGPGPGSDSGPGRRRGGRAVRN